MPPPSEALSRLSATARAGNHRFRLLGALTTNAKTPYKTDFIWRTLKLLHRPGRAQTEVDHRDARRPHEHDQRQRRLRQHARHLGSGRIVVSETQVPNMLVSLVWNG
jgi:hypothetical protein